MECKICHQKCESLINDMMCELCYSQSCMDDDGGPVKDIESQPKRVTKGDQKAKRRYNRYRKGGPKGRRKSA